MACLLVGHVATAVAARVSKGCGGNFDTRSIYIQPGWLGCCSTPMSISDESPSHIRASSRAQPHLLLQIMSILRAHAQLTLNNADLSQAYAAISRPRQQQPSLHAQAAFIGPRLHVVPVHVFALMTRSSSSVSVCLYCCAWPV